MSDEQQLQYTKKFGNNLIKFSLSELAEGGDIVLGLGLERIKDILVDTEVQPEQQIKAIMAGVNISRLLMQRQQVEEKKNNAFIFDEDDIVEQG